MLQHGWNSRHVLGNMELPRLTIDPGMTRPGPIDQVPENSVSGDLQGANRFRRDASSEGA